MFYLNFNRKKKVCKSCGSKTASTLDLIKVKQQFYTWKRDNLKQLIIVSQKLEKF